MFRSHATRQKKSSVDRLRPFFNVIDRWVRNGICVGCVGSFMGSTAEYVWAYASAASVSSWNRPLTMSPHGFVEVKPTGKKHIISTHGPHVPHGPSLVQSFPWSWIPTLLHRVGAYVAFQLSHALGGSHGSMGRVSPWASFLAYSAYLASLSWSSLAFLAYFACVVYLTNFAYLANGDYFASLD